MKRTRNLPNALLALAATTALLAAAPRVSNVTAEQRAGTKKVDITYDLVLDGGQTAYVEVWFSHDDGFTFPISAKAISGDVLAGVQGGTNKSIQWDAEKDWDSRFTPKGKIRIIATYGNEPSVFSGTGDAGSQSSQADASLVSVQWGLFATTHNGTDWTETEHNWFSDLFTNRGLPAPANIAVDPQEITNAKWNEIVEWGRQNGYSSLQLVTITAENEEMPVTNITFWEALQWCNARSEKEGLTPAYYTDPNEIIGDHNGDGNYTNGNDTFSAWDPVQDTNMNGKWDPGENFNDLNSNSKYDGREFFDLNSNGTADLGLSLVYKSGAQIPNWGKSENQNGIHYSHTEGLINWDANGYRLPDYFVVRKLLTGGSHKKKWPWGDTLGPAELNARVRASIFPSEFDGPSPASNRQPNGFGLKDLLGNVAEWSESGHDPGDGMKSDIYGGSYKSIGGSSPFGGAINFNPAHMWETIVMGPASTRSPEIGFRCVRYK
ncbi:MAG: hypothetical protein CMO63_03375 [Verrucomicrobiales bacterium]|nr:hypothetical protein [Verrucomicrobiales bacterium]